MKLNSRCEHLRQVAETAYTEKALYHWDKKDLVYNMLKRIVANAFDAGFQSAIAIYGIETRLCAPISEDRKTTLDIHD